MKALTKVMEQETSIKIALSISMSRIKIAPIALSAIWYTSICLSASAQKQNGAYNPPLGTKTLYVAGKDTDAPAPAGYAPFFINYIGRHGARHATLGRCAGGY